MSSFSDTSFFLFFLLSLSSLPQLSGPGRAGVGDVQSCAASRGRLPSSRHSALSLSLALPLSQRKPLCDSSQRTLSEPNTASPAPGGERERESWDGKGMRGGDSTGREARRRPQTKNREELGLPRVQWPRNSFSRCPPPVRFLLVFWGEDF